MTNEVNGIRGIARGCVLAIRHSAMESNVLVSDS
jgi:hypothetical protein